MVWDAFGNSFLIVALTEMGDKTQLLALLLAARFRRPMAVMGGIFVATVLNHLLAAGLGGWAASFVPADYLRWGLALTFLGFGLWVLIPDSDDNLSAESKYGAFLTTTIAFFLAEMGDKTQLSTVAMAARYQNIVVVTIGTTLGMLAADGLAVMFGESLTKKVAMKWIRFVAAGMFILFAALIVWQG